MIIPVEAGCGIPVFNKIKASLEGLDIVAGLIIMNRTDALKNGMKRLILLSDSMRNSCLQSAAMASRAILCFGGNGGINMEGLVSIRFDVFSIILIVQVYDNKDYFEEMNYNKHIYKFSPGCTCQLTR